MSQNNNNNKFVASDYLLIIVCGGIIGSLPLLLALNGTGFPEDPAITKEKIKSFKDKLENTDCQDIANGIAGDKFSYNRPTSFVSELDIAEYVYDHKCLGIPIDDTYTKPFQGFRRK